MTDFKFLSGFSTKPKEVVNDPFTKSKKQTNKTTKRKKKQKVEDIVIVEKPKKPKVFKHSKYDKISINRNVKASLTIPDMRKSGLRYVFSYEFSTKLVMKHIEQIEKSIDMIRNVATTTTKTGWNVKFMDNAEQTGIHVLCMFLGDKESYTITYFNTKGFKVLEKYVGSYDDICDFNDFNTEVV